MFLVFFRGAAVTDYDLECLRGLAFFLFFFFVFSFSRENVYWQYFWLQQ